MGVICKYKYDSSIYADLIPEFNSEYSGYVITDEVEGNIITRTIESDSLPTLMRFGRLYVEGESATDNRTDSLLEVLDMNTSGLTSCNNMFRYNKKLTSIICKWDTSNVTDMNAMFCNCDNLISLDLSNFNTSNVTNMDYIFNGCFKLTTLDVSNFDTSKVTSMLNMFYYCDNLTSLDVSNWNTSNVTNMQNMFYNCNKLSSLDVSNFDTSNVISMQSMFDGCNNLTTLDLSNWNTSNVTNMYAMFYDCANLTSLDLSNFDTSKVTNMIAMFTYCFKLTTLDVSNFNTSNVTTMYSMFYGCNKLTTLDLSNFDTSKVINTTNMFHSCDNLTSLDLSNFNTSNVTNMNSMFYNCSNLTNLDLSGFDTSKVTDTNSMFANTNSLEVITMFNSDINTINTVGNLTSATIYVDESLDQSQYTGTALLKVYKEEKLEIKLSSPLLKEDTIEVVDGKICHVHRMGRVVLDGSKVIKWNKGLASGGWTQYEKAVAFYTYNKVYEGDNIICNKYKNIGRTMFVTNTKSESFGKWNDYTVFRINPDKLDSTLDNYENEFGITKYFQENPTTIIYELETPYYEDITPLQSSITLKTFLESYMTIDTILPIETKLSYRTNVPSISTLSTRATELAESDNVIHNLMNIIDDEVDE